MAYILLDENNIVIQKQLHVQEHETLNFIEAPDDVICGQIRQTDGSFIDPPPAPKTYAQLREDAYIAKGWLSQYDVIDDAMTRGWDVVLQDRHAIKQQFPKPQPPAGA